jgi:hypothetical protein
VTVQPGSVSPLAIEFDAVRRICDHQDRLALAKEACDIFCAKGVSAQHSMFSANPQVTDSGHGILGNRRRGIGCLLVGNREQSVYLAWVEAGQAEIEVRCVEFLQLQ